MTASVKYWRLPEEEADMVAHLQSLGPTMALPIGSVASPEQLIWKPVDEALRSADDAFLITPARFTGELRVHRLDDGFIADVVSTPALYYSRGKLLSPQRLVATSLSADWSHLSDDNKTMIDKPAEFVRWGKNVMQWVRRIAPGWHEYKHERITPKAEAARQAGLELVR